MADAVQGDCDSSLPPNRRHADVLTHCLFNIFQVRNAFHGVCLLANKIVA